MNLASLCRLLCLSAIWGASFLFMRIAASVLGAPLLIESRVALAAVFLFGVGIALRQRLELRRHWRHYGVLGLFNSALPFLLFGIAAQTLSASLLSILNATAPIWGALIGAAWNRAALKPTAIVGLGLGIVGVGVLVGWDATAWRPGAGTAIALALGGACSYGVATTYAKTARAVAPFANAHGSMWAASLMLLPLAVGYARPVAATPLIVGSVLALGIVCSGIAYLLYFRLVDDLGPTSALTVTFLVPVFGVLWGHLFLGEPLGWGTLAGACIVVTGTALVTGFTVSALRTPAAASVRTPP